MKKAFTLFTFALFVVAMISSLASAELTVTGIPSKLSQSSSTFDITISSDKNETVALSIDDIYDSDHTYHIDFADLPSVSLDDLNNRSITVQVTYTVDHGFEFILGEPYEAKLKLNGTESPYKEETLTFEETSFCEDIENEANIKIQDVDVKVINGYGDDDDYWYLRDEIDIEIAIEPTKYDIEDVEVEWKLYNTAGKLIDDGDFSVSDIDKSDEQTETFTIKLDSNIDDFDGEDAVLYIRATGKIDDNKGPYDGDKSCVWDSVESDVETRDDFVIVDNIEINDHDVSTDSYNSLSCGQEITISGNAWNIGEDDQDDVYIEIYSKALELYEKIEFNQIDAYDSEDFSYTFEVPENLDSGKYSVSIEVFDEDNEIYENDNDDKSEFLISFKIDESCIMKDPTITAEGITEAIQGKEYSAKVYLTNNNDKDMTYSLSVDGFESWAKLVNLNPAVLILGPGDTKEATVTLDINKNSLVGSNEFNIIASTDGKEVVILPAAVDIEEATFNIKDYMTKDNLQIAGIVLLNLILLIAIIIVAKKILRRK